MDFSIDIIDSVIELFMVEVWFGMYQNKTLISCRRWEVISPTNISLFIITQVYMDLGLHVGETNPIFVVPRIRNF